MFLHSHVLHRKVNRAVTMQLEETELVSSHPLCVCVCVCVCSYSFSSDSLVILILYNNAPPTLPTLLRELLHLNILSLNLWNFSI